MAQEAWWTLGKEVTWQHPEDEHLRLNAFLFSVVCLYSTLNVIFSPLTKRKDLSTTATAIHACGCVSYFFMGNNWFPVLLTSRGWPLRLAQVVEWSLSVPLFLTMLSQLDPMTASIRNCQASQSAAIVIGAMGPLFVTPSLSWGCFAVSMYLQALVLLRMHSYMVKMRRSVKGPQDKTLLFIVHVGTLSLFCLYPVFWALGPCTHRISPRVETLAFSWLDFVTKFIFTTVLCNLTTQAYEIDLVDYEVQFWNFMRLVDVPVFALSREKRVVFWNGRMEEATEIMAEQVLGKAVSKLSAVFPENTRRSISALVDRGQVNAPETRYEVPIFVGARGQETRVLMLMTLCNQLEEITIPKVIFLGAQQEQADSTTFVQLAYYLHNSKASEAGDDKKSA